jgi:outer membrane protein assembly factor BamA
MKVLACICVLAFSFSVSVAAQVGGSNQAVVIHKLTLTGASRITEAEWAPIAQDLENRLYEPGTLSEGLERLRSALLDRGYFKAVVFDPRFTVLSETPTHKVADVRIRVDEGRQYRLSDIQIEGATAFPPDDVRAQFPISSGDIFNVSKIKEGLDGVRRLYGAKGYVNFTPIPDMTIDEDTQAILLKIVADEGPIFQTGKLTIQGVGSVPGVRDRLLQAWKVYEGSTYNGDVLDRFLRDIHASPDVKPEDVFKLSVDSASRMVNVELTLAKPLN